MASRRAVCIAVLSPGKTMNEEPLRVPAGVRALLSAPLFAGEAARIMLELKAMTPSQLSSLQNVSGNLAELNRQRVQDFVVG